LATEVEARVEVEVDVEAEEEDDDDDDVKEVLESVMDAEDLEKARGQG
jgi:hypothetical protein